MSQYSESYMREHCIDVYFQYGNNPIHVLTDGNYIPEALNDRDANRTIQQSIAHYIPNEITLVNVSVEQAYLNSLSSLAVADVPFPSDEVLLRMFAPMAQLGFYSYDCTETYQNGRGRYVLVASPDYPDGQQIQVPDIVLPQFEGIQVVEEENGVVKCFIM